MRFPHRLNIISSFDGLPIDRVLVCVTIKTKRKNDFKLVFGPTNKRGRLTVTWQDIIKQALEEKAVAQMDYGDPEYDFAGQIIITPLTRKDLDRAIEAYELFRTVTKYPRGWSRRVLRSKEMLSKLPSRTPIKVTVEHDGKDIRVTGVPVLP